MPHPTDPANLEGDELDQWYRRSPQEIEEERQAAEAETNRSYFGMAAGEARQGLGWGREHPA